MHQLVVQLWIFVIYVSITHRFYGAVIISRCFLALPGGFTNCRPKLLYLSSAVNLSLIVPFLASSLRLTPPVLTVAALLLPLLHLVNDARGSSYLSLPSQQI